MAVSPEKQSTDRIAGNVIAKSCVVRNARLTEESLDCIIRRERQEEAVGGRRVNEQLHDWLKGDDPPAWLLKLSTLLLGPEPEPDPLRSGLLL